MLWLLLLFAATALAVGETNTYRDNLQGDLTTEPPKHHARDGTDVTLEPQKPDPPLIPKKVKGALIHVPVPDYPVGKDVKAEPKQETTPEAEIIITCNCLKPGAGQYSCGDGVYGSCPGKQECFAKDPFIKGVWKSGCREMEETTAKESVEDGEEEEQKKPEVLKKAQCAYPLGSTCEGCTRFKENRLCQAPDGFGRCHKRVCSLPVFGVNELVLARYPDDKGTPEGGAFFVARTVLADPPKHQVVYVAWKDKDGWKNLPSTRNGQSKEFLPVAGEVRLVFAGTDLKPLPREFVHRFNSFPFPFWYSLRDSMQGTASLRVKFFEPPVVPKKAKPPAPFKIKGDAKPYKAVVKAISSDKWKHVDQMYDEVEMKNLLLPVKPIPEGAKNFRKILASYVDLRTYPIWSSVQRTVQAYDGFGNKDATLKFLTDGPMGVRWEEFLKQFLQDAKVPFTRIKISTLPGGAPHEIKHALSSAGVTLPDEFVHLEGEKVSDQVTLCVWLPLGIPPQNSPFGFIPMQNAMTDDPAKVRDMVYSKTGGLFTGTTFEEFLAGKTLFYKERMPVGGAYIYLASNTRTLHTAFKVQKPPHGEDWKLGPRIKDSLGRENRFSLLLKFRIEFSGLQFMYGGNTNLGTAKDRLQIEGNSDPHQWPPPDSEEEEAKEEDKEKTKELMAELEKEQGEKDFNAFYMKKVQEAEKKPEPKEEKDPDVLPDQPHSGSKPEVSVSDANGNNPPDELIPKGPDHPPDQDGWDEVYSQWDFPTYKSPDRLHVPPDGQPRNTIPPLDTTPPDQVAVGAGLPQVPWQLLFPLIPLWVLVILRKKTEIDTTPFLSDDFDEI